MSHDLRTPLNTMMGFSQLLKWRLREEDGTVGKILAAGCQMMEILEQLAPGEGDCKEERVARSNISTANPPVDPIYSVLYVEDNLPNYNLVERIMAQREQIKLFSATLGEVAVQLARESVPDLILLDLNLPDMHGTEVLRRLREDPLTVKVPVVVISADASPSQIERLLAAGARNYLTKPFQIERLLYTVDEILGGRRSVPPRPALSALTENKSAE